MHPIEAENVSDAWTELAGTLVKGSGTEVSPAIVTIRPTSADLDDQDVRRRVDAALAASDLSSIRTVANTIFPASLWRLSAGDRRVFFDLYGRVLPRVRKADPNRNRNGLYFERLVAWGEGPADGNQLEFIIDQHRKGRRRSAYQAAVFDPVRDHSAAPRQGFPCLQHLSFLPSEVGLSMNAFYATQRVFDKAYGNYLGLLELGRFMGDCLEMKLVRLTCYVGVAKLGATKRALHRILDQTA